MPAYKNFWSLNTDEAVVTGILRENTSKNIEVLMPINAQMKDIDLILMNKANKKILTVQVKGSRAYEPKKNEIKKFGDGSNGWFWLKKNNIMESSADYFIFLVYVLEEDHQKGRRKIMPHTLVIPTKKLQELCLEYKKIDKSGKYHFYFWVKSREKIAFEWRNKTYDVSEYLDKNGFEKLNKTLE